MLKNEYIKIIIDGKRREMMIRPGIVYFVDGNYSEIIVEHEPGARVYMGCSQWGLHVWGTRSYSVGAGCDGSVPLILKRGNPPLINEDENGWKLIIHDELDTSAVLKPWSPVSVIARGDMSLRKGVLWVVENEPRL